MAGKAKLYGDPTLNRHADFLYTLFGPAHARQAIPCFDQPDLKGRWSVRLEHPAHWQSVAKGREIERTQAGGRTRVRFAQTPPLPTYLVAFAAGEFKVETGVRNGRGEGPACQIPRVVAALILVNSPAVPPGKL